MRRSLALLSLLTLAATISQGADSLPPFTAAGLHAHMQFLADDLLEGRGTGTRGYQIAANYVAAQFEEMGLRPGGEGKSWFQTVPFRKTMPVDDSSITVQRLAGGPSTTLRFADGFMTGGDLVRESASVEGPVVFAGFGITAPELKQDDYAGIDVRGKIVIILTGAPTRFPNDQRAHYSASLVKLENAAAHGAVGVLTLFSPSDQKRYSWERIVRQYNLGSMAWMETGGAAHGTRPEILASAVISKSGADALLAGSSGPIDDALARAEAGTLKPYALPTRASIHINSRHSPITSPNVVGILDGSDPQLRSEYVVYSAHLDHLGISAPVDGDSINNGALDNASGVATVLEIARAFASQPERPRRSIIFLCVTGEEKGLRGSDYFANNPTVPLSSLVADVNIDEILMLTLTSDAVVIGAEHSGLEPVVKSAADELGIALSPDPAPEEVVFVRSDNYSFVKRGVPAVGLGAGYKALDPSVDGYNLMIHWIESIYHSPKDDMSQPLDFREAVKITRFGYLIGAKVANAPSRPRWKPSDFFGTKFGSAATR
jgi:hypothetical protein